MFAQSRPDTSKERESLEPQLREKAAGGRRDRSVTRPHRDPNGTENSKYNRFSAPLHLPSHLTGKGQAWSMQFLGSSAVAGWESHSGVPTSTENNSSPPRQDLTRQDRTRGEGRRAGAVQVQRCDFPQPVR